MKNYMTKINFIKKLNMLLKEILNVLNIFT